MKERTKEMKTKISGRKTQEINRLNMERRRKETSKGEEKVKYPLHEEHKCVIDGRKRSEGNKIDDKYKYTGNREVIIKKERK